MKRSITVFISVLLFAPTMEGQSTNTALYARYSIVKKEVSVLEWKLLQVNLKIADTGYFVQLDGNLSLFTIKKIIPSSTLEINPPATLREFLLSECNLVAAAIGSEFEEFRLRGSKDLMITFLIGEQSARQFASFSSGSFSFNEEYYNFRKEHGH